MKQKLIAILGAIIVLLGGYQVLGSVQDAGGGYYATTTIDWNIGAGGAVPGYSKLLKNGPGLLGSVIIVTDTAGALEFYDATSTSHGHHATTTLMKVPSALAEGTYTIDANFFRGLLVVYTTSNVASSTITWK